MGPVAAYQPPWPDYEAAARREAQERLDRAARALDVPARGEVTVGAVGHELVGRSADVDLLVLGSRAYGPLRRLIMGSTSTYVARHAACPVLVLPRGSHQAKVGRGQMTAEPSAAAMGQE